MILICAACQKKDATTEVILLNNKEQAIGKLGSCANCLDKIKKADVLIRDKDEMAMIKSVESVRNSLRGLKNAG